MKLYTGVALRYGTYWESLGLIGGNAKHDRSILFLKLSEK